MTERVLIVSAHPDDETLGCGATIAKHVRQGDQVSVVMMADGISSRPIGMNAEAIRARHGMARRACKLLGTEDVWLHQYADNCMDNLPLLTIVQHIETHVKRFNPTIVYTHWKGDMNVDHRVVAEATLTACRPQPGSTVKRVLMFEVPSSTEWGQGFTPTWYVDVEETLQMKLEAMNEYAEELREWPHPRSLEGIENMARIRGSQMGVKAAEAFVVSREIC